MISKKRIHLLIAGAMWLVLYPTLASFTEAILQDLPDGDYRYYEGPPTVGNNAPPSSGRASTQSVLLRKKGDVVVGIHLENLDSDPCFSGVARQNTISNITYGYPPPMGQESSTWTFSSDNGSIDLNVFRSHSNSLNGRESLLAFCVEGMRTGQ